jgi:hypothetical protein
MANNDRGSALHPPAAHEEPVAFSNAVRLTGRQWLGVGLVSALFVIFAPVLWKQAEPFDPGPDYRIPHDLSEDYWFYERYAGLTAERYEGVFVGDSVVWGEYVRPQETLSHYLNEQAGQERYANLGLEAAHPLALAGLIEHYGGSIAGREVVLQCNPLWLSSPRADWQDEKSTDRNHERLVPQFWPRIPTYRLTREKISERIGIVVQHHLPMSSWTAHLQQAYYRSDIPSWTLAHPYEDPFKPLAQPLPPPDNLLRYLPQPWYKSGKTTEDYPWVDLESSLQWQAFRRAVTILRQRDNRVFVLVGPFNEHMLTTESLRRYEKIKAGIAAWLDAQQIPHAVPPPLPSDLYGDASHPLAAGYSRLARVLREEPFFRHAGQ